MMHRNDFVVVIRPAGGGKTFREYKIDGVGDTSDTRTRKISVPFNQEYEFVFKNMKTCRRSVTVSIDGDEIGSWVIGAAYHRNNPVEVILERFMDSDKRFKVLHQNDGGVADPSNPENGKILIKVTDEKQVEYHRHSFLRSAGGQHTNSGRPRGMASSAGPTYSADINNVALCSSQAEPCKGMDLSLTSLESNVATGEGSHSGQTFTSTFWNGDVGVPIYFVFVLHGVDRQVKNHKGNDQQCWTYLAGFCIECGTKLADGAKFCQECGTEVRIL